MNKYLITGITGFCAAHLANRVLADGHEVHALVRRTTGMETDILDVVPKENYEKIKFHYGDLTDRESLMRIFENEKFDGVYHLAAQSLPPASFINPLDTFRTNIMGSANLIDVVEKTQGLSCKFCFVSTSEVYGNAGKDGQLLSEETPMEPSNPYAVSKSAIDLYVQERMMNGKLNGFITRAFSHTGPRRGKNFSISCDAYQISRMILSKAATNPYNKDGEQLLPYQLSVGNLETRRVVLGVTDVAEAYYRLMMHPKSSGQVFNVCGNVARKMEYFTDKLIEMSGLSITKVIDPALYRKHDIHCQRGDSTKLKKLTKWEPKVTEDEFLTALLEYWITKMQFNNILKEE